MTHKYQIKGQPRATSHSHPVTDGNSISDGCCTKESKKHRTKNKKLEIKEKRSHRVVRAIKINNLNWNGLECKKCKHHTIWDTEGHDEIHTLKSHEDQPIKSSSRLRWMPLGSNMQQGFSISVTQCDRAFPVPRGYWAAGASVTTSCAS